MFTWVFVKVLVSPLYNNLPEPKNQTQIVYLIVQRCAYRAKNGTSRTVMVNQLHMQHITPWDFVYVNSTHVQESIFTGLKMELAAQ